MPPTCVSGDSLPARVPDEDEFRALARSSPWLFRTLHFTRHGDGDRGSTEAWLARPGRLVVQDNTGERHIVTGVPYSKKFLTSDGSAPEWVPSPPQNHDATWRADGLVAERPDRFDVDYDDPMRQSYDWVAMLDPVELSAGSTVADLAVTHRSGRETWWASMTGVEGYDPRCSCCPLL